MRFRGAVVLSRLGLCVVAILGALSAFPRNSFSPPLFDSRDRARHTQRTHIADAFRVSRGVISSFGSYIARSNALYPRPRGGLDDVRQRRLSGRLWARKRSLSDGANNRDAALSDAVPVMSAPPLDLEADGPLDGSSLAVPSISVTPEDIVPLRLGDFDRIVAGVAAHVRIFGDARVYVKFRVPTDDARWPEAVRGFDLGRRLFQVLVHPAFREDRLRDKAEALSRAAGLEPGAVYDSSFLEDPWTVFYAAFKTFRRIYGTGIVPTKFTVPSQADAESPDASVAREAQRWPRLTRGLPLGVRVAAVRSTGAYVLLKPERKRMLDALGFLWSSKEYADERARLRATATSPSLDSGISGGISSGKASASAMTDMLRRTIGAGNYSLVLDALQVYRSIYGSADVPLDFVVPSSRLSDSCSNASTTTITTSTSTSTTSAPTTTSTATPLLTGPREAEAPGASASAWPEALLGYPLGAAVQFMLQRSKVKVHSASVLDALDELGFPWYRSDREKHYSEAFEVILQALRTYRELYGNLYVGQLFVVPSSPPWPQSAWGMRLGSRVATIRARESYIKGYPERRSALDALGFAWEVPLRLRRQTLGQVGQPAPQLQPSLGQLGPGLGHLGPGLGQPGQPEVTEEEGLVYAAVPDRSAYRVRLSRAERLRREQVQRFDSLRTLPRPREDDEDQQEGYTEAYKGDNSASSSAISSSSSSARRSIGYPTLETLCIPPPADMDLSFGRWFQPLMYREEMAGRLDEDLVQRSQSDDPMERAEAQFEHLATSEEMHRMLTNPIPSPAAKAMRAAGPRILEFGPFTWDDVMHALQVFKLVNGHVDVPLDYTIDIGNYESTYSRFAPMTDAQIDDQFVTPRAGARPLVEIDEEVEREQGLLVSNEADDTSISGGSTEGQNGPGLGMSEARELFRRLQKRLGDEGRTVDAHSAIAPPPEAAAGDGDGDTSGEDRNDGLDRDQGQEVVGVVEEEEEGWEARIDRKDDVLLSDGRPAPPGFFSQTFLGPMDPACEHWAARAGDELGDATGSSSSSGDARSSSSSSRGRSKGGAVTSNTKRREGFAAATKARPSATPVIGPQHTDLVTSLRRLAAFSLCAKYVAFTRLESTKRCLVGVDRARVVDEDGPTGGYGGIGPGRRDRLAAILGISPEEAVKASSTTSRTGSSGIEEDERFVDFKDSYSTGLWRAALTESDHSSSSGSGDSSGSSSSGASASASSSSFCLKDVLRVQSEVASLAVGGSENLTFLLKDLGLATHPAHIEAETEAEESIVLQVKRAAQAVLGGASPRSSTAPVRTPSAGTTPTTTTTTTTTREDTSSGYLSIPLDASIPVYPERLHGLQLGHALQSIRVGDVLALRALGNSSVLTRTRGASSPTDGANRLTMGEGGRCSPDSTIKGYCDATTALCEQRQLQLRRLGVRLGTQAVFASRLLNFQFIPLVIALRIYKHLNTHVYIPLEFVVPEGSPLWPVWLHGYPLGLMSNAARIQQRVLRTIYPHRYEMLCDLGVPFWLPPDPDVPDDAYQ